MMTFRNGVLIGLVLVAAVGLLANQLCAEPLKIKGFYIGMPIDDALENFERLGFEGLSIREKKYRNNNTYYTIRPGSGDPFKVETGLNVRTVSIIFFSDRITDRLFNTRGIGADIFQKSFADAYDIQGMKTIKDNPGTDPIKGWEHYNLKDGYRIRIFLDKNIEIIKTNKAADFAFD